MKTINEIEEAFAHYRAISQIKPAPYAVTYFFRFCRKHSTDGYIHQEHADEWAKKRPGEDLCTRYTRVFPVKQMLEYACQRGWTNVTIENDVRSYTRPKKMIFLTEEEIGNFFRACDEYIDSAHKISGRRYRHNPLTIKVLFLLMYSAGLRPSEARLLARTDVNTDNGVVSIRATKGYREHIVVAGDDMLKVLRRYDEVIDSIVPNRIAFFPNHSGGYFVGTWLTIKFRKLWYKYNQRRAVSYCFRHHYAIDNINSWNGISIDDAYDKLLSLSRSMGHGKLADTLYYYSLSPQYANNMRELSSHNINQIIHDIPDENEY